MTLRDEIEQRHRTRRKSKQRKTEPVITDAPIISADYVWGMAQIGAVIGRTEKQCFHLAYKGLLDGAVKKIGGCWVGYVPKLRALMGGD